MNVKRFKYLILPLLAVLCCSCAKLGADMAEEGERVLLSVGDTPTKGTIRYMPDGVRFACRMYYQANNSTGAVTDDYLATPEAATPYFTVSGNEGKVPEADIKFFWHNRNNHIFLGYTDLSKAGDSSYSPAFAADAKENVGTEDDPLEVDYTNVVICPAGTASMASQPDPVIALTRQRPEKSTQEGNRVYLTFRHQLSQVVVNIKAHEGNALDAEHIKSVSLLGVSEEAHIYPFFDETQLSNASGRLYRTAKATEVNLADFTEEQLEDNKYGTLQPLFNKATTATGYLKSFEGVSFGTLKAIRVIWTESDVCEDGTGSGIEHVVDFRISDGSTLGLRMESGTRYVYNLEMSRAVLALLKVEIIPWEEDKSENATDGYISDFDE